jgi:CRISPR-associated endonuclease Cas2
VVFLVAYDIADPKRLRRVARLMERLAVRSQKSVFLFHGDVADVLALLDEVTPVLNLKDDCVQAWALSKHQPRCRFVRGTALPLDPAGAVLQAGIPLLVEKRQP